MRRLKISRPRPTRPTIVGAHAAASCGAAKTNGFRARSCRRRCARIRKPRSRRWRCCRCSICRASPAPRFAKGWQIFPGLPHRLREVARRADGVSFIDDSKATNVAAAIFALRATPHASAMIVGGAGKGQDFSPLAAAIAARQKAAALAVFVVGEAMQDLAAAFATSGARFDFADSVAAATRRASCAVGGGGAVLLSPACASTDSFVDFAARGIAFQAAAREAAASGSGGR